MSVYAEEELFVLGAQAVALFDVGALCAVDRDALRSKEVVMLVKLLLQRGYVARLNRTVGAIGENSWNADGNE